MSAAVQGDVATVEIAGALNVVVEYPIALAAKGEAALGHVFMEAVLLLAGQAPLAARTPLAPSWPARVFVPHLTRWTEVVYDGDDGPISAGLTLHDAGGRRECRESVAGRAFSPKGGRT